MLGIISLLLPGLLLSGLLASLIPATARKRVAASMQRVVIDAANSVPVQWYSRIVAHVSTMTGWKIIPTHFANQDLADVRLDQ